MIHTRYTPGDPKQEMNVGVGGLLGEFLNLKLEVWTDDNGEVHVRVSDPLKRVGA